MTADAAAPSGPESEPTSGSLAHRRTERLALDIPVAEDVDELFALNSDPRVWTHFPSLRTTDPEQSRQTLEAWQANWEADGLGWWIVRDLSTGEFLGYAGCFSMYGVFWNLGYRLRPEAQGQGLAIEAAREAVAAAHEVDPERPVVAYLVEHNESSARVAQRLGFTLQGRAPDAGNPDPDVMRLVYADRALSEEQLAATLT